MFRPPCLDDLRSRPALPAVSDGTPSQARIPAIDLARGAALVGMALYHLSWDLAYFRIFPGTFPVDPPMRVFSHVVAGAFLLLVGVSLALAHSAAVNWRGFLRRLAIVGAAAALVTLATYEFAPDEAVFFGILHCIAVASALALWLVRAPPWVALATAALAFSAPFFLVSQSFNSLGFVWLGLSTWTPRTLDWRPLFPWSGFVFLGLGLTCLAPRGLASLPFARWRPVAAPWRALTWAGKHSLAIYLVHQPILFGALLAWTTFTGFDGRLNAETFSTTCQSECRNGGGAEQHCIEACQCVVKGLQNANLAIAMSRDELSDNQREGYSRVVRSCITRQ
jgi:uncharacterized membrane protein